MESPDGKRVLAEFEFGPVCGSWIGLDGRSGGADTCQALVRPPALRSSRQPAAAGGAGAGKVNIFFQFATKKILWKLSQFVGNGTVDAR